MVSRFGVALVVVGLVSAFGGVGAASAAGTAAATGEPQAAEAPVVFVPHRAIYDLKLDEAKSGSGVVALTGRIVLELTGSACEGYAQTMRLVTVTTNQDGEQQTTDLRTSSWENVPAKTLRFNVSTFQNEMQAEQTQGVAQRDDGKGGVRVALKRPQAKELEVKGDIYFPIQHSMAVVRAAKAGKSIFSADLYDGSDGGGKAYATSTVIGQEIEPGSGAKITLSSDSGSLDQSPSWPIAVSYFPMGEKKADTLPTYEMSYRFHENGVTSKLRIDHGAFSIKGELKELLYLEPQPCK